MQQVSGAGDSLPRDLRGQGLMLRQVAPAERLIPYFLRGGIMEGITEATLRSILVLLKAPIVKREGEKSVSKKTVLWSLIIAELKDSSVEDQLKVLLRFFAGDELGGKAAKTIIPDELTAKALNFLPHEEVQGEFQEIKVRLDRLAVDNKLKEVLKREGGERARKLHETPDSIKSLKPPGKTVLCMDVKSGAFEAYYPGGKPTKSVSYSWTPEGRSKLGALTFCLQYLWKNHEDKGREPGLQREVSSTWLSSRL